LINRSIFYNFFVDQFTNYQVLLVLCPTPLHFVQNIFLPATALTEDVSPW